MVDVFHLKDNVVEVNCNINIDELTVVKQFVTQPHGASVVGLTMIDPKNKGIDMTLKFDSAVLLKTFVTRMLDVWHNYRPIKSHVRSFKEDGVFLEEYMDMKLLNETYVPRHIDDFKGSSVMFDLDFKENDYKFTILRWSEPPRNLYCYAVAEEKSLVTNLLNSIIDQ